MSASNQGKSRTSRLMGQIPLEDEFRGVRIIPSVFGRILHVFARYLPMYPGWRAVLHRMRGVNIGKGVFIGSDVGMDRTYPKKTVIEDYVTIIGSSMILGHTFVPFHLKNVMKDLDGKIAGVRLKRGCYIGARSVIMPGVVVGECAIVGAGSVVTSDVPDFSVVMGSPARVVRTFDKSNVAWPED